VCVRKFTTVTRVVHEVPLDQPSLKTQKDPENPENPENEELSLKFSRDTVMVVLFLGNMKVQTLVLSGLTKTFFFKELLVVHKEHSAQTYIG